MKDLFFVYCNESGFELFETLDDALDAANERILGYFMDGWCEEVTSVCAGKITHRAQMCDQVFRDGNVDENGFDEAGDWWDPDWEYKCNYKMLPVESEKTAFDVSHIVKLLDRARLSVDYQMSAQNQNHEAGRKHYAHFQSLLGEIDAAITSYRKQGGGV